MLASQSFWKDRRGAVALIFTLALPLVLAAGAIAVEYGHLVHRRSQLQQAADAGTLAGAAFMQIGGSKDEAVRSTTASAISSGAQIEPGQAKIEVLVTQERGTVAVTVEEEVRSLFGRLLSLPSSTLIVRATARLVGTTRLCLLALDPVAKGALHLEKNAQVTATGCSLYSNSKHGQGMAAKDGATARSQSTCSAGGFDGTKSKFTPSPITDCPVFSDPLKDRPLPTAGSCTLLSILTNPDKKPPPGGLLGNVVTGIVDLDPGTYCGGLQITNNAQVNLRPGIYIMKDGPLIVNKNAKVIGKDVSLFFTGSKGGMLLDKDTTVSLSAPTTGIMAGFLMSEDRTVSNPLPVPIEDPSTQPPPPPPGGTKPMREYRILSDNTRTMLGTIYLPVGRLIIDAKKPVADQSAYTVILAQQINLYEGPNLYLNANYGATSVPVPRGVGPTSGEISLIN